MWNMTGRAECCYTDGCNDNRNIATTTTPATTTITTSDTLSSVMASTAPMETAVDSTDLSEKVEWSVCNRYGNEYKIVTAV